MPRVLVVDDEPSARMLLEEFLTPKGYDVITASNGEEALRLVKEQRPHLILLDVCMPKLSGIEVLQRVRQIDPSIGVIMVTAVNEEAMGRQALAMGAFDYITKPLDLKYLEQVVWYKIASMVL